MEEAPFDVPLYRAFTGIDGYRRLPNENTILRFHHRLKKQEACICAKV